MRKFLIYFLKTYTFVFFAANKSDKMNFLNTHFAIKKGKRHESQNSECSSRITSYKIDLKYTNGNKSVETRLTS